MATDGGTARRGVDGKLVDRVGCARQTIILLEQGRYAPSLALAFRIARVFDLTVDEVFELADETGGGTGGGT